MVAIELFILLISSVTLLVGSIILAAGLLPRSFCRAFGLVAARRTARKVTAGWRRPVTIRLHNKRKNPAHRERMRLQRRASLLGREFRTLLVEATRSAVVRPSELPVAQFGVEQPATLVPCWEEVAIELPASRQGSKLRGKHRRLDCSGYANARPQNAGEKARVAAPVKKTADRKDAIRKDKEVKRAMAKVRQERRSKALAARLAAREKAAIRFAERNRSWEARRLASLESYAFVTSKAWDSRKAVDDRLFADSLRKEAAEMVSFYGDIEDYKEVA